ncbi:MAG: hypothetical protein ACON35_02325 [Candidatus Marinamargulisbacteria bacterium]
MTAIKQYVLTREDYIKIILNEDKKGFNIFHCFGNIKDLTIEQFNEYWRNMDLSRNQKTKALSAKAMAKFLPGNKINNKQLDKYFKQLRKNLKIEEGGTERRNKSGGRRRNSRRSNNRGRRRARCENVGRGK